MDTPPLDGSFPFALTFARSVRVCPSRTFFFHAPAAARHLESLACMPQAVFSPSRKIAFFSFTSNWPTGRRPRATSHAFPCLPPCLQLLRPILPSRAINPVPSPFDLDFSPFAAFQLLRPPPSCYHWPMSPRTSNPPPPPPLSRAPLTGDQFPKWNGNSNRNIPKLRFAATHTKQSFGRFLIDTFRAFVPRAANFQPAPTNRRYYNSNHGTYEKLEVIENKGRKAILIAKISAIRKTPGLRPAALT